MNDDTKEAIGYMSFALFGIVFIICIMLAAVRGCEVCKQAEVETERIHFSGRYEQRMVVGHGYPVWVKIATDTMESTPDSLQQPIKLRSQSSLRPKGK